MIGSRLEMLRRSKKLTRKEMAKILGVHETTYGNYELEKRSPDSEMVSSIADFFECSIDYLLGRTDNPNTEKTLADIFADFGHTINEWNQKVIPQLDNIYPIETQKLPLLGEIAAGEPMFADEGFEFYVEAGAKIKADYALKVKGDSMINARINDGDIVFVKTQPTVGNGEIAVVLIDDTATLKRFYQDGNTVTLVSENPAYPPKVIHLDEATNIRILGKAVAFQSDVR